MNKLTVTNGRQQLGMIQDDPLSGMPSWLVYLVGAYPGSKMSEEAFLVMEDAFCDFDPSLLYSAAREFLKTDERAFKNNPGGFPTASEFMPIVKRLQARQQEREQEARVTAFDAWFTRCQVLRVERLDILEGWYNGAVSDHELSQFAGEMERAGMVSAAASLRSRL